MQRFALPDSCAIVGAAHTVLLLHLIIMDDTYTRAMIV